MESEEAPLERRVEELAERLTRLERRMDALRRPEVTRRRRAEALGEAGATEVPVDDQRPLVTARTLPLIGRSLLVLGGAFLLRAATEAGALPRGIGSAFGWFYAVGWLAFADRSARRNAVEDATFHGIVAAAIAFPLLFEVTVDMHVLPVWGNAAAVAVTAGLGFAVAWRREHAALAWVFALGAVPTTVAVAFTAGAPLPPLTVLLALGASTLWMGYLRGWMGLAWMVALVINVVLLFVAVLMLDTPPSLLLGTMHPVELMGLDLALVAVYPGSVAVRTLALRQPAGGLELGQAATALAIGLGGVALVSPASGLGDAVGVIPLAFGGVCYAAAFGIVARRGGRTRGFHFFATVGLALVLAGAPLWIGGAVLAYGLAGGGVLVGVLGVHRKDPVLTMHGIAYLLAAVVGSGLGLRVVDAFVGPAEPLSAWASGPPLVSLVALAATTILTHVRQPHGSRMFRFATDLALTVLALALGALVVGAGASVLAASQLERFHDAALATLRTGVLAATAVSLGASGRITRRTDLRWLAYAVVAAGALKLLLEDLRVGSAATLFVSLGLYGGSLILVSRFASRPPEPARR